MRASSSTRATIGMAVFALVMSVALASLGVWQLQRGEQKHALMKALDERLAAAPVDLPPQSEWTHLNRTDDEFRRVRFAATYENKPDAMVYTSGSAVRSDVTTPGVWAFLPAQLERGARIVINTGFVPNEMQKRDEEDRAIAPLLTGEPAVLTGYLRFPERPGLLTAQESTTKRLWFVRDIAGMAEALGWGEVAPFYIDLEAPVPTAGVPKPSALSPKLKDNHLGYAITWFGLAIAVLGTFGVWLFGRRRA
ncbi:SURF1 family protein [Afipia carboxidovorans]|uniref:SURF1 family protein n=1 Tax=Afipia carboxidovorans TaxID=40137 RepID=UPI0030D58986